jgi:replicative DNA helicase
MDLPPFNKDRKAKHRRQNVDLSTMVYGKVPPQAKDLEEVVLGAIMLEKNAIDCVQEILQPECFYVEAHQRIYRAMQSLQQKNQPIDIRTVVEELRTKEELELVGGPYYVTQLTNSVVSAANIESHSRIIMQKFILREVIRIGGEMVFEAYENSTDVFDLLDDVESQVMGITLSHMKKDFRSIDHGLVSVVQRVEELRQKDSSLTGVPSGFKSIDNITHGWQSTDLIILAARPSVGKTAFALNLARNAALHSHKPVPVGFFSLEMSETQLIQRILASESEIWLDRIVNGRMDDENMKQLYAKGIQKLAQAPIFIDDTAGLNMFELRSKVRRMKKRHDVGLIIIDYLQLMTGDSNKSENREREIAKISRELKKLAKDIEIPILALSQLSRAVEQRGKGQKVPMLSDLRESGAIEQDADMVMFLYRPPEDEVNEDPDLRNKGMVRIAKHRNGKLDEIVLKFYGEIQRWMELDEADRYDGDMGNTWKPVSIPVEDVRNYSESVRSQQEDNTEDEDLPF